jgi:hypothetical protein
LGKTGQKVLPNVRLTSGHWSAQARTSRRAMRKGPWAKLGKTSGQTRAETQPKGHPQAPNKHETPPENRSVEVFLVGGPSRTRTVDTLIKSQPASRTSCFICIADKCGHHGVCAPPF